MAKRLTSMHELIIGVRAGKSFTRTVEFCIERGEGTAAPTAVILDEGWKAIAMLSDHDLAIYGEDGPTVSKPALERMRAKARDHARFGIKELYESGAYTLDQIKAALPKKT